MTRRDYEEIAKAIARARMRTTAKSACDNVALEIALYAKQRNERFDHERFFKASHTGDSTT